MTDFPSAPAPMGLTEKQRRCLDAIRAHFAQSRAMPSVEDLRVALALGSKTGVFRLLRQLEERGRIVRLPRRARAIRIVEDARCPGCGASIAEEARAA